MSFPIPDDAAPSEARVLNALNTFFATMPNTVGTVKEESMAAIRDLQKVKDPNQRERNLRAFASTLPHTKDHFVDYGEDTKLNPADAPQWSMTVRSLV